MIHEDGSAFPGETHPVPTALATGKPVRNVVMGVYRPSSRDRVWLLVNAEPERSDARVTQVICTFSDITEVKKAEEALFQSEERYRALFNEIDDAIFIHDEASNILDVNQAACERLGYSRDELLHMKTIDIDAPDYAGKFHDRLNRQLSKGTLQDIEGTHVSQDGRHIPVHVNSRTITFKGQTAVLAVARDISVLKLAEEDAINLATERSRVRALADFVRDLSHDFRTPLTAIGASAYLLFRSGDLEKRQYNFGLIETNIKQMSHQIERLLLMARLDAIEIFAMQTIQIEPLIQELRNRFFRIIEAKGIQLVFELPSALPTIQANEQEIAQALGEIVENALIFTPPGSMVTLKVETTNNAVIITVQDSGNGIPATDLPHIFKRLYRGDAARSMGRGAVGLGLSIAEKIIQGHKGRIEVESTTGNGSMFRIVLPLRITEL